MNSEACGCRVEYDNTKIKRVSATGCYAFMDKKQREEFNK